MSLALSRLIALVLAVGTTPDDAGPIYLDLFPREKIHNHSSCVVECPNGDLLTTWYRGSGERKADDVQIFGARLRKGSSTWEPRFLMADTPGYPDCNPALFVSPSQELWLFYPTILDHHWEGALLKYAVSGDYVGDGPPVWKETGVFHVTPTGFAEAMEKALNDRDPKRFPFPDRLIEEARVRGQQELYQRLGWMPRVHLTVLESGRWLLPLYTDTFSVSLVATSDDQGKSWQFSSPMIGFGNIQPSLVERKDGTVVAYMRDNGPPQRICVSESKDGGTTWGPVERSNIVNPGAGIESIRLQSGRWLLVYNDVEDGRHTLAVALSDDEGKTWRWKRRVEEAAPKTESFHYPSAIQTRDGVIHLTYTHGGRPEGSTIRHAQFREAWILASSESEPGLPSK